MIAKLVTEHYLKFLSLKKAAQAGLSLYLSKCHIVENHILGLICSLKGEYIGPIGENLSSAFATV